MKNLKKRTTFKERPGNNNPKNSPTSFAFNNAFIKKSKRQATTILQKIKENKDLPKLKYKKKGQNKLNRVVILKGTSQPFKG
jgi:hypothetical protein